MNFVVVWTPTSLDVVNLLGRRPTLFTTIIMFELNLSYLRELKTNIMYKNLLELKCVVWTTF